MAVSLVTLVEEVVETEGEVLGGVVTLEGEVLEVIYLDVHPIHVHHRRLLHGHRLHTLSGSLGQLEEVQLATLPFREHVEHTVVGIVVVTTNSLGVDRTVAQGRSLPAIGGYLHLHDPHRIHAAHRVLDGQQHVFITLDGPTFRGSLVPAADVQVQGGEVEGSLGLRIEHVQEESLYGRPGLGQDAGVVSVDSLPFSARDGVMVLHNAHHVF